MARQPSIRALRGEATRYSRPGSAKEGAILDAATRLFGERGFEATHTAEIASAAGVTERTLFRYFSSKEKLYRRVMVPALLAAAVPRALDDAGELFATDARHFSDWQRNILDQRVAAARRAAPQFRLLIAGMMTDESVRRRVIGIWEEKVRTPLVATIRRFQDRGQLRSDLPPDVLARAIISLNLGYIIARALIAPEAAWDDRAEIDATVEVLVRGAAGLAAGNSDPPGNP
jgi:AcrR family transcriptional regulator